MFDFNAIRGDSVGGQRDSFEQLICRLAELDGSGGEFRRIRGAGGDGGVEALRLLHTGKKVGYQAKFFTGKIDWDQISHAVETALIQHPELERYVIAIPRDFTGKRAVRGGSTEGEWGDWDRRKKAWEDRAAARGMRGGGTRPPDRSRRPRGPSSGGPCSTACTRTRSTV